MPRLPLRAAAPLVLALVTVALVWGGCAQVERQRSSQAVIQALMTHNLGALRTALDHGGDANTTDQFGSTVAGPWGQVLILFHLKQSAFFQPALFLAAGLHDLAAVRLLLSHGADPNIRDGEGRTPIIGAMQTLELYNDAYAMGGGKPQHSDWVAAADRKNATVYASVLTLLQSAGGDVNAATPEGETALMLAAGQTRPEIVALLLQHGAKVNRASREKSTALSETIAHFYDAAAGDDPDGSATVLLLLKHGADPNSRTSGGDSLLHLATGNGDFPAEVLLLQYGADPKSPPDGSLLSGAVTANKAPIVRMLLRHGVNPNLPDEEGRITALTAAATQGSLPLAGMLLAGGADPNRMYDPGETPLMAAAARHDAPMVGLLLAHGADPNRADGQGDTALMDDAVSEPEDDYRRRHNGVADDPGYKAGTMHWPAGRPIPMAAAALLLAHGAHPNAADQDRKTALGFAQASGKTPLVELLRAHGARQ